MKLIPALRLALFLVLASAANIAAEERWYVFSIGDVPVGYVMEEIDGARTRMAVFARLTRLGKSIDMRFETTTTENAGGDFQSLEYEAVLSKQPVRVEARVQGDRIQITTPPHERFVERGAARVLGPLAVTRLSAERLRAPGDAIDYSVFSPELQRVVKVRRRVVAAADRAACAVKTAKTIEEAIEGMPTPRTVWLDADATVVGDSIAGPFGPMATCRATKEAALAANGTLPADLYEKTVAPSNVRLADPSAVDRIVLRIRARDGSQRLPDFVAHNQRALEPDVIEIRRPVRRPLPAAPPPDREFIEPNALVESTNEAVVAVAKQVAAGTEYETALALTTWTAEHLSMDAGIVMAPASELIRDRKATCMGYATLLAALARAAGLPSRVVMGYVYYGGIWGGHAWTDIRVDGQWLPFDGAVFAPGIASATRLAVGASSLADGGGSLTAPLGALFGRVDVDTIEYEADGRVRRVDAAAKPFQIVGTTYLNRGLGLRIRAEDWTVERADSRWPSSLVAAFRRGSTTIELHQQPRYPQRPLPSDADALFANTHGGTRWVWLARGGDAAGALRTFLARVERVE